LFVELSISWPVLLEAVCPMRVVVFGRLLRSAEHMSVCAVEKYEFRTQARAPLPAVLTARSDSMVQRWADYLRKETVKTASA
jgi:hypothetical protein